MSALSVLSASGQQTLVKRTIYQNGNPLLDYTKNNSFKFWNKKQKLAELKDFIEAFIMK